MQRQKPRNKVVVGLTGSFGSGKTTVAMILKAFGAECIDADALAHDCLRPGTNPYRRIVRLFGRDIVRPDKAIDRARLGRIAFSDSRAVRRLNSFIHPEVIRKIKYRIKSSRKKVVILDVPLLIESGLDKIVDMIIVVKATQKNQIARLKKRSGLSASDIKKRCSYQIPLRQKMRAADFVIDNNDSISETKKQVARIRRKLWRN